jgi:methyl-accepting chemotaxis protein
MKSLNLFARLKIGGRIYAGFTVCLVLLGGLGALGFYSLQSADSSFSEFGRISKNTLNVARSERDFVGLRRNIMVYTLTGDEKVMARANDLVAKMRKDIAQMTDSIVVPERKAKMQAYGKQVEEYWANFEIAIKLRTAREKLVTERMNVMGVKARSDFSQIIKTTMADGDFEAAAIAGQVQEALMLARLNAQRFLANPDPKVAEDAKQNLEAYHGAVTQLIGGLKNPETKRLATDAGEMGVSYAQAFGEFVKLSADLDKLVNTTMAGIAEQSNKTVGDLTAVQAEASANLESDVKARNAQTTMLMISISIAAFGLGLVLAFFIARSIVQPVKGLTEGMHELADGNFDVVLPGLGRKDEIGDIAQAVETFKVKAAEKAQIEADAKARFDRKAAEEKAERDRIEAEQKIEADKRAAAEREAATAKIMNEFDAAVGGIVKAAMAGDFSQRVPLEGKGGVIRNLADAMNRMCDNMGKVMDDLVTMLGSLAEGDLTKRINASYEGTFGTLKDSANTTAERLSDTISKIKAAASEVANASAEISTSTTDLSQRTEEQAAGLEETSASMEQISVTVKKNAENAQQANTLTNGTRQVAERGGAVVASTVEAMSRIEESSRKIADIIGVIDEIARQTNLLALNAAVEAARAGDAGRGFAVVASEVRSLAQRSSQAAKDIKDLITSSTTQVQQGVDLVNRAGVSLTEIVESIKSVATIVADIASASAEQATGLDQVNKALSQMDEVTQQNSALVEENAATAKTLEQQSTAMDEQVSFFRLDGADHRVVPMKSAGASHQASKSGARKPSPSPKRGIVGRMQSAVATAFKHDPDTEEF